MRRGCLRFDVDSSKDQSSSSSATAAAVRWYPFLVGGPSKRSADVLFESQRHVHGRTMVVCRDFNRSGSCGGGGAQPAVVVKQFAIFDSFLSFLAFSDSVVPPAERTFYEVICEGAMRPFFDIDIGGGGGGGKKRLVSTESVEAAVARFARCAEEVARASIKGGDREETNAITALVCSSNATPDKLSYHIIIAGGHLVSSGAAREFCYRVVGRFSNGFIPGTATDVVRTGVDTCVYRKLQQLRILGSQKYGTGRIKVFRPDLSPNGSALPHGHFPGVDEYTRLFAALLVSTTTGTPQLNIAAAPSMMVKPRSSAAAFGSSFKGNHHPRGGGMQMDVVTPEEAYTALADTIATFEQHGVSAPFALRDPFMAYEFDAAAGVAVIPLKRTSLSHCPVCNKDHDHENPYLAVSCDGGSIRWFCRRARRGFDIKTTTTATTAVVPKRSTTTATTSGRTTIGAAAADGDAVADGGDEYDLPIGASAISSDNDTVGGESSSVAVASSSAAATRGPTATTAANADDERRRQQQQYKLPPPTHHQFQPPPRRSLAGITSSSVVTSSTATLATLNCSETVRFALRCSRLSYGDPTLAVVRGMAKLKTATHTKSSSQR